MAAILTSSLTRAPVILNVTLRDLERLKSVAKTLSQLAKVQNIFLKIVLEAHDECISENIQTALEIFGVARYEFFFCQIHGKNAFLLKIPCIAFAGVW